MKPTFGLAAVFAAVFVAMSAGSAHADLRARPSATQVGVGQSFSLELELDGGGRTAAPDLSPLNKDFDVLGTGQRSQTSIINGVRTDTTGWTITLSPKAQGRLTIPALTAGGESSQPITIEAVEPSRLPPSQRSDSGIALEVIADTAAHYVQEEIPLTVRIFPVKGMREPSLSAPSDSAYILTQTGEDQVVRATRNGQPVQAIERKYLLKPQKSGPLTVAPFTLQAVVSDGRRRSPFGGRSPFSDMFGGRSPFGRSPFDDMFTSGRRATARSEALTLDIKPRPTQTAGWFLPAKQVKLTAEWDPANPVFEAGKSVTRKIRLLALGASKEQLPELDISQPDGAKIYVDKSHDQSVDTPQGTAAVREIVTSVVPTRAGEITLPAIEVKWWDTQADTEQVATLPPQTITVAGGAQSVPATSVDQGQATVSNTTNALAEQDWSTYIPQWRVVGLGFVGLLGLFGAIMLLRRSRARGGKHTEPMEEPVTAAASTRSRDKELNQIEKTFHAACKSDDPSVAYTALTAWLNLTGVDSAPGAPQLSQISPDLADELMTLERALYAREETTVWKGRQLLDAFEDAKPRLKSASGTKQRQAALPPLYPEPDGGRRAA